MKAIAAFLMKGRMQAILGAALSVFLSLLITPFALVSAAIVVLATLRQGWHEGMLVVAASAISAALLGGMVFGMPVMLAVMGLSLWLPAFGFAVVLGFTRSLRVVLEAAVLGGAAIVLLQYAFAADPVTFWAEMLNELVGQQLLTTAEVDEARVNELVASLAAWMPGGLGASWFLGNTLAIMLALMWDARLDGRRFADEFEALRFSYWLALVVPVLMLVGVVLNGGQPNLFGQMFVIGIALYLIQGLAMVHGLLRMNKSAQHWLFGLYFLLIFAAPHSATAIALAGYADAWINFRAKARNRLG